MSDKIYYTMLGCFLTLMAFTGLTVALESEQYMAIHQIEQRIDVVIENQIMLHTIKENLDVHRQYSKENNEILRDMQTRIGK